jgi:hypothetical protein
MNTWTVLEWAVFICGAIWTLSTNVALRKHYKNSDQPTLPANSTAMTQLIGVAVIAMAGYSPFHLVWILPIAYLVGFIALRSRFVGRIAWLYGYVVAYTISSNW